jgi:uncharacterized secreted protein with C-terminal beta-propeller domain
MALRVLYLYEKRETESVTEERYTFRSKLGPGIRMRYSHAFFKHTQFLLTFWPLYLFPYTYSIRAVSSVNTEVQGEEFQAIFFTETLYLSVCEY